MISKRKKKALLTLFMVGFTFSFATARGATREEVEETAQIADPSAGDFRKAFYERPELFWQPRKGHTALSLSGGYSSSQYTGSENLLGVPLASSNTAVQSPAFNIQADYGISHTWAVSLEVGSTLVQKTVTGPTSLFNAPGSFNTSGPSDILFSFKNSTPFEKWILHFGANINFSLDLSLPANSSTTGNNYSGSDGVSPYIGASWNLFGASYLGIDISYNYRGNRVLDPNRNIQGSALETGQDSITLLTFFEWHRKPWVFYFHTTFSHLDPTNIQTTAFNVATLVNLNVGAFNVMSEEVGAQYYFSKGGSIKLQGTLTETPTYTLVSTFSTIAASDQITQNGYTTVSGMFTFRNEF